VFCENRLHRVIWCGNGSFRRFFNGLRGFAAVLLEEIDVRMDGANRTRYWPEMMNSGADSFDIPRNNFCAKTVSSKGEAIHGHR